MLHKFRVQYILIDFSDNGFLVVRIPFWKSVLAALCGNNKRILRRGAIVVLSDVWLAVCNIRTWEESERIQILLCNACTYIINHRKAKAKHLRQHRKTKISLNNYYYVYSVHSM